MNLVIRLLTITAILLFVYAARAEDPRKIDFTVTLTDQDGVAVTECVEVPAPKDINDCKVRRPVTLGMIALRSLSLAEPGIQPDEALKRGQLGLNVYKSPDAQLTAEEIALIKKQINKAYNPFIVARAFPMLDPASK